MSYTQWLGQLGAAAIPNVTEDIFRDALRSVGHVFDLYVRGTTVNCSCFNDVFGVPDRDCPYSGGTGTVGGYSQQPDMSFMGFIQLWSEGRQDQHQRIYEKAGPIETMDGQLFTEARWYEVIHNEDVLVWKPRGSTDGYELRVISKLPRFGSQGQMVFIRLDVTKNPYPLRRGAVDLRSQV